MAKLSKTITEQKVNEKGHGTETRITVEVDYNGGNIEVRKIVLESNRIQVDGNTVTHGALVASVEATDLLLETFPSLLNDINGIDWEAEYREGRAAA